MLRIGAIFIAICMVLIAASVGAVLFLGLKLDPRTSAIVALAVLIALALYNTITTRLQDRRFLAHVRRDIQPGIGQRQQLGRAGMRDHGHVAQERPLRLGQPRQDSPEQRRAVALALDQHGVRQLAAQSQRIAHGVSTGLHAHVVVQHAGGE